MKIATVAACPVFGANSPTLTTQGEGDKGVHQVVRLDNAVAVIAEDMWAAEQGLAALDIHWNEGPNATLSSADMFSNSKRLRWARRDRTQGRDVAKPCRGAKKVEAVYQMPFSLARNDGADELHRARTQGRLRGWVGSQVLARATPPPR